MHDLQHYLLYYTYAVQGNNIYFPDTLCCSWQEYMAEIDKNQAPESRPDLGDSQDLSDWTAALLNH